MSLSWNTVWYTKSHRYMHELPINMILRKKDYLATILAVFNMITEFIGCYDNPAKGYSALVSFQSVRPTVLVSSLHVSISR